MKRNLFMTVAAIAVTAGAIVAFPSVPTAQAEENMDAFACQYIGTVTTEPLGDREGHVLRVADFSCLVTAGPLSGGVTTGRIMWEGEKTGGTLLAGEAVTRKPGATVVNVLTDGKLELMMSDGKVVGVTTSGHGRYVMATGSAASISGKSFEFTTKTTGPGQYSIDVKRE